MQQDPEDDQDEQGRADRVHDSLEMTLIRGTLDERRSVANERAASGFSDDGVSLAALAASSVVADVTHVLVDSKRFSGDGRLIAGNKRMALGDGILLVELLLFTVILLVLWVTIVELVLFLELHVELEVLRVVKAADETDIAGNGLTFLNDDNVTRYEFAGENRLLLVVTDDDCLHGDVTLQTGDDIGSLLFLVPTDESVEQQNTANDTEIDPILKTGGQKGSELHNYRALVVRQGANCAGMHTV